MQINPVHTTQSYLKSILLAYFPRVGLWDHVAVCVCLCIHPINFWTPEPISMKLGMYITAPEPISTA
jgi:hypothetical protein